MLRKTYAPVFLFLLFLLPLCPQATAAAAGQAPIIALSPLGEGPRDPVGVVHATGLDDRLYVLSKHGRIHVIEKDRLLPEPFLDITDKVSDGPERGLLGLAFPPDYATSQRFYVHYSDRKGDTVIARYDTRAKTGDILLHVRQTTGNHNGGQLAFGPDGYLYIGLGDGGSWAMDSDSDSGGDPYNYAQDLSSLLGKILRIDVGAAEGYRVPPDNPFVSHKDAAPEIWALGFKNPWRFSFDREDGALFLTDVGQVSSEEISLQPADSRGGENYGWRRMEGSLCFNPPSNCNDGKLVLPIIEYDHYRGCAIIGGYRYRGKAIPALSGIYLYADFCNGKVYGARPDNNGRWQSSLILETGRTITSFGEDGRGELYLTTFADEGASVFRIVAAPDE